MKKYFLYIFACVCALTYATTAQAQTIQSGDIITISSGTNYLAVNGNSLTNATTITNNCYWEVTITGSTYTFESVVTTNKYLCINSSGYNSYALALGNEQNFTKQGNKYYATFQSWNGQTSRYISYNNGWTISSSGDESDLTLNFVKRVKKYTAVSPAAGYVKEISTITVTGNADMESVDASMIQLKNGNGESIAIDVAINANQLIITPQTTPAPGTYTLTIVEGAVKAAGNDPFMEASYTWNVDPNMSVAIVHSKGFYDEFIGTQNYQKTHTVERTIYYTGEETELELRLAESNLFGYMRWYDYNTDRHVQTEWSLKPRGGNKVFDELTDGSTHWGFYGLHTTHLSDGKDSNNSPKIKPWADKGEHTVACDVSSREVAADDITKIDNSIVRIVEPTLSYRQLFHFKPATQIADKFVAAGSQFLENYEYTAPSSTNDDPRPVMLSTQFRYKSFTKPRTSHSSELCYYYYKNGVSGELGQVGVTDGATAKWYKVNGEKLTEVTTLTYPTFDYLQIEGQAAGTEVEYQLIVSGVHGGNDLKIARFVVKFVDVNTHGPLADKGSGITWQGEKDGESISFYDRATIETNFDVLSHQDFDFGQAESDDNHLNIPFTWEQSTYGFYHTDMAYTNRNNHNFRIPYMGEYMFVQDADLGTGGNNGSAGWLGSGTATARSGYAMFVDGTTEPGLVASIIADRIVVCAERTMYCSMWLRNPHTSGTYLPTFRCNIMGRKKDANGSYSDWENIGIFYVGSLDNNSGWKQVVFPITPQDQYDEIGVQVYNFGTGENGNDFMIDDLTLFSEKSLMSTYQVEPSTINTGSDNPFTMAVLRVDYSSRQDSTDLYYQIYDLVAEGTNLVKSPVALNYFQGESKSDSIINSGYVKVPAKDYVPTKVLFTDVDAFYSKIREAELETGIYYVPVNEGYAMYVVHKIQKEAAVSGPYPYKKTDYGVRMSYDDPNAESKDENERGWDNLVTNCTMDMRFAQTQETTFELRNATNSNVKEFMVTSNDNCANNLYYLDLKITEDLQPEQANSGEESAMPYADWLKGIESDHIFAQQNVIDDATANNAFKNYYGYPRDSVTAAIQELRKLNRTVADTAGLNEVPFKNNSTRLIIKQLCRNGHLELYRQTVSFYLGSNETARYWVFPIEGSAKKGELELHDNPEPKWVEVSTYASKFSLTIFNYELPDQYSTSLPTVRVLKSKMKEEIIINYAGQGDENFSDKNQKGDAYLYSTTDMQLSRALGTQVFQYNSAVDNTNHIITLEVPDSVKETFAVGSEYVVAVTLRDDEGKPTPEDGNNGCPVGTWFFNILVVPDVVEWAGAAGAIWGDDANWQGYEEGETVYKFAPIKGSRVVIPAGTAPKLTELSKNPMQLHLNYPMTPVCGEIYFENGATIENQHLLQHDKAIVDLVIPQGTWNSVSVPIAGVVTGDMFIPHENEGGNYQGHSTESEDPFDVQGFNNKGTRSSKSAYAFWQSFFNRTVSVLNENPNKNTSSIVSDIETNTTTFAPTNSLFEPLVVGSGHQLKGWGPTNIPDTTDLVIRLPKPDNAYSYFYSNGTPGTPEAFDRGENAGKLVYNPDQAIMLTGESAETNYVMFGNPTMAYINMPAFLAANASMLNGAYYSMNSDSWDAATAMVQATETDAFLAPMRSVMLELKDGVMPSAAESGIYLKPEHLVADPVVARNNAPSRAAAANKTQIMTIVADVQGTRARCVVAANGMSDDKYRAGEDALFFSSGVEAEVSDIAATSPVNMYTVSERVPMMVDVRKGIDTIPMAMLVKESSRTETMKLTFTLSAGWDKDVYFCDAETGSKILIVDGMEMEVTLPANHETRYFLEGPDTFDPNGGGDIWSSTDDVQGDINVWAYSQGNGQLTVATNDILKSVEVYDLAGRLIADRTLDLQYSSTSIDTPTGACIVKAVLRDNSVHYLSALVK